MSIKQKMINKLADVLTRGRKIQIRQGEAKDFKPSTLDVGEFGLITDENRVMIGTIDGTPMQVNGGGSVNIPDASTTEKGIVQLVDDLTSDDDTKALTAKQGKVLKQAIDSSGGGGGSLSPEDRDKLDNLQKYVYGIGTRITTQTDLDTLLTPGIYYTTNNAGTNLLTNAPTVRPNGACIVEVRDGNGTTGLIQTIYYVYDGAANNKASSVYSRIKYGTFAEWSIIPKLDSSVLLTTEKYDINKIINELKISSSGEQTGSWTPNVPGFTLDIADGSYVKSSKLLTAFFDIRFDTIPSAGIVTIKGLPFAPKTPPGGSPYFYYPVSFSKLFLIKNSQPAQNTAILGSTSSDSNEIRIDWFRPDGRPGGGLMYHQLEKGSRIIGSVSYHI